jgi:hypothetical protein
VREVHAFFDAQQAQASRPGGSWVKAAAVVSDHEFDLTADASQ